MQRAGAGAGADSLGLKDASLATGSATGELNRSVIIQDTPPTHARYDAPTSPA
jgi:hypothetical protein